jgi:hypothetical protein
MKGKTKITKENSRGTKHRWKRAEFDHVKKGSEHVVKDSGNRHAITPKHLKMAM